jgi:hypothetical protein
MFPSLKDPEHTNVRLKNVGRQVYLCVTQDEAGNPLLGTKTLTEAVDPDGEYTELRILCWLVMFRVCGNFNEKYNIPDLNQDPLPPPDIVSF